MPPRRHAHVATVIIPQGLEYLHSKGLVHLNLKLGNIIVGYTDKQPTAKLADLGLVRTHGGGDGDTAKLCVSHG